MPLSALPYGSPTSISIWPTAPESLGGSEIINHISGSAPASAAWPTANLSIMYPFSVSQPWTAKTMYLYNGTTAQDNFDLGIYNDAGTLLVSKGSTAQTGTSALQLVDITDTVLIPGRRYYMAAVMDGTTAHSFCWTPSIVGGMQAIGMVQVASNFPLATGVTFAAMTALQLPYFGASRLTVY